jgi:ABC-type multidrug transport system ATPase subunit/peptidoglycan/LPS O-acetylase OafA/YrhL
MSTQDRLHALDFVRAFALLLGVVFHAGLSFVPGMPPGVWAMVDNSPSAAIGVLSFVSHIFRMSLFFFIAGFFARMMFHRRGARGFWADRAKRILVPLVAGWVILFPTLAVVWIWGIRKTFGGVIPDAPAMPPPPPGAFPLTHLWFLYYLLVLYAVFLAVRWLIVTIDRKEILRSAADAVVRVAVRSYAATLLVALPVAAALYLRPVWLAWGGIPTPDQSLIPQTTSFVAFGTALTFGWLIHRQMDLLSAFRSQWPLHFAGAIVASIVCLSLANRPAALGPLAPGGFKLFFAASYALAIWSWSFAILGFALRFMAQPNARVRYVADASYWIYLVHLPIVAALQVLVGRAPWHWTVKFPFVLVVSFTLLFLSYHFMVRSTFVGQLLNNRKYPRRRSGGASGSTGSGQAGSNDDSTPTPTTTERSQAAPVSSVVTLRSVHKRYGKTTALAGLDLDVRKGELLAVLGPNGAGKSTAISLCLGLLEPDQGAIELLGRSPLDIESRRSVGVMMQEVGLTPELRVRELIDLTASYYPTPLSTDDTLRLTRTAPLADRLYAKLSAGQKRQVQFALAICGRPPVLFLDEPSVGLDVEARETMWRTIREMVAQGCSIVLTTHYIEEAEALADRVAVLANGRLIAFGTVDEIRSVVSRKQIVCTTSVTEGEAATWPSVVSATRETRRLRITAIDAESVLRKLLAADAQVRDLEVRQAGLAEAFADLTKEAA